MSYKQARSWTLIECLQPCLCVSANFNPLTTANIKREFSEIAKYFHRHFRVH